MGCSLALPPYNQPFQEKVIVSSSHEGIHVRISESEQESIPVQSDGRAILNIPVLPRKCSTYFWGFRLKDRSVEARKLIEFLYDGRVIKRISVKELRRLPVDPAGYHKVKLK